MRALFVFVFSFVLFSISGAAFGQSSSSDSKSGHRPGFAADSPSPAGSVSEADFLDPRWLVCKKNRDCTVIQGVCGLSVAVADRHHEKAIRALAPKEGAESCAPSEDAVVPLAECKAGKCVLKR